MLQDATTQPSSNFQQINLFVFPPRQRLKMQSNGDLQKAN